MNSPAASPTTDSLPASLAVVHSTMQRLAGQSASCKLWSVGLAAVALLFAAGRSGGAALLWAAVPAAFLGLVDAACVAEARRMARLALDLSVKDKADPVKVADLLHAQAAGPGYAGALKGLAGVVSPSVWPFYLGLAGLMVGMAHSGVVATAPAQPLTAPGVLSALPPQGYRSGQPLRTNSPFANNPNLMRTNTGMPKFSSQGQRPAFIPPPNFHPAGGIPTGAQVSHAPPTTSFPTPRPIASPGTGAPVTQAFRPVRAVGAPSAPATLIPAGTAKPPTPPATAAAPSPPPAPPSPVKTNPNP